MKKWSALAVLMSSPLLAHTGPHVVALPVTNIVVDGDFADWPKDVEWRAIASADPKSLTARFAVGLDRARGVLNVAVDITDDVIVLEGSGQDWDAQDGVDIYVDVPHRAARDLTAQYFVHKDFGFGHARLEGTARGVRRAGEHRIAYEFEVDLAKLAGARGLPKGDAVIGFDVIALDRDGPGRFARASWTPGEEKGSTNAELGDAWLTSAASTPVSVTGQTAWVGVERAEPPRRVFARRRGDVAFFVSAPVGAAGRFTLELPPGEYEFRAADTLGSQSLNTPVRRKLTAGAVALEAPLVARPLQGKLDDLLPKLLAEYGVRAAQVAVIENGRIKTSRAWGVDKADNRATKDTVFRIASITKVVTTMTVMNLVEQGAWDLDQPLTKYWTDSDLAADARSQRITTRLVLQHRTGLPNWRDGQLKFDFDPGTGNQYSGEGLEWLRRAVERATGEKFEALATRLVFEPAGMKSTTYIWPAWVPPRYSGEFTGDTFVGYVNEPEANGAADLMSTAEDLARFGIWVMNGGGISKDLWRVVEDTSANAKDAGPNDKVRGLGWCVTRDGPHRDTLVIHHGGGQRGIATELFLVPGEKRGLVVLTNGSAGRPLLLAALNATLNARGAFPRLQMFTEDRARE
jgi:CubicO group peptidase (beta-lactamase class C family)